MMLSSGDMLVMDSKNGALKLQVNGATTLLKGADVAEFLNTLNNTSGEHVVGDSGLSVEVVYDDFVLSAKDVSARLTRPERTLLVYAVRDLAWRMFQ